MGEEPETGTPGILVFQAASDGCAAARELAERGARHLIAIAPESDAPTEWAMLRGGAEDVISCEDASRCAASVRARLERWAHVDAVLASPLVRDNLVGDGQLWKALLRRVIEVAVFTDASVLLLGPSGSGKELMAQLVHTLDRREAKGDMVVLDCSTIVPELAGSELFGHERGAFTGAAGPREGALALAGGGTLFLDEVGELPQGLQPQLLRAIQERAFKPVGGNLWRQVRFRLVCATNRDLSREVASGAFRHDLYHRIATCVFRLPSLGERVEDVLPLARHFLRRLGPSSTPLRFTPAVEALLVSREYPGNVRELRQLVSRIVDRHVGAGPITLGDVPPEDRPEPPGEAEWRDEAFEHAIRRALARGVGLKEIGRAATDVAVRLVVEQEGGNLQRAARKLGVTDRALQLRRAPRRARPDGARPVS